MNNSKNNVSNNFNILANWFLDMGCDEIILEECQNHHLFSKSDNKFLNKDQKNIYKNINSANLIHDCSNIGELKTATEKIILTNYPLKYKGFIFYEGYINADLMVVADNPQTIDINGIKSFQKEVGTLLLAMLKAINFSPENTFFTTLSFCTSIDDKYPTRKDIEKNIYILKKQIELVSPKVIVMFGSLVTQCLTGTSDIIFVTRGQKYKINLESSKKFVNAVSMYQPEYLIARPDKKKEAWTDLIEVKKMIETSS